MEMIDILSTDTAEVLKPKDTVFIVQCNGNIVKKSVVSKIINNYAIIDDEKYWMRATKLNGKHRKRTNYCVYAMTNRYAQKYCGKKFNRFFKEQKKLKQQTLNEQGSSDTPAV